MVHRLLNSWIYILDNIFKYWCTCIKIDFCNILRKKWEKTKFCFLVSFVLLRFIHYRPSSPFATLIRVNRWENWGKGLPWIGVTVKKGRERVRKRERERDRPFRNFISTRLHLRDSFLNVFSFKMLSDPRGRSQERSVEKRSTIFRQEVEFHSTLEFFHECIFYRRRNRNWGILVSATNSAWDIFLSINSLSNKYTFLFTYRRKIRLRIHFTNKAYNC